MMDEYNKQVLRMKKEIPVEKNKDYIIDITGMGSEGEGIGKVEGFTVFIQGALINEKVKARIIKLSKSYAVGKLLEVITPSQDRREPLCSIYKRCGGCQLQHMSYEGQLDFKRSRVKDALERIGGLKDIEVNPVLGMENPLRYRNKVQLPVGGTDKPYIGFYSPRSHDIIDMDKCYIQNEAADRVVKHTREWMEKCRIRPYDEATHSGLVRHIMVRQAYRTGEIMVVLVTNGREIPYVDEYIEALRKNINNLTGVLQNINTDKTNVILGKENIVLWGREIITDYIGRFKFNISPHSFFQVNPVQTEVLYNKALEFAGLTGNETVFDAYCGTGTISLFLADKAKKVYGVEIIPQAIENAKENARVNNITNVEFITGEAEKVIPELIEKGIRADVVVVDPPRKGCDESLLHAIGKMEPDRIVYVSCDPGTLARDLAILTKLGYEVIEVQPVDMFPETAHVETIVLMSRKDK